MSPTQENRNLEIYTSLGKDVLLLKEFSFHEQLGRLFSIKAELRSKQEDIDFEKLLGDNVSIRMNTRNEDIRFIHGYITHFSQMEYSNKDRYTTYQATISPSLWFMTRTTDYRIFQNKTVPEIIFELFADKYNFIEYENRLVENYQPWEYCVQYNESDFNFISRLIEQEGIYYFFTHDEESHMLILCDSPRAHQPIKIGDNISYYPSGEAPTRNEDHISSWSINKKIQSGKYALADYDFKKPRVKLSAESAKDEGHKRESYEVFHYPGKYNEVDEGDSYAEIRIQELHVNYEKMQGTSNARSMEAGGLFTLNNYHRDDQNDRKYLITSVKHVAKQDDFTANSNSKGKADDYSNTFTVIDYERKFRSSRITPKPIIQGLQTAYVVGQDGEEIDTDEYGRVKCKFHWDRDENANENSSCWIRVAQTWAGNHWGSMYIPRIGQEVIVEFLEGDPDRPIITGQVYNESNKPPYDLPSKKNISGIKTRSTLDGGGFNEITMDDTKDKEQIFIHAQKQHDQRTNKNHLTWVGQHQHHRVEGNYYDEVREDRHQTIGGELNCLVKDTISIESKVDIHQKAAKNYAHESGNEIHLKAGAKVVIEAGTQISLKVGGNFIDISPSGVTISGTMVKINSGGSAGSGVGSEPEKAKLPKDADNRKPPKNMQKPAANSKRETPQQTNPTAATLRQATKSGTPFCEVCNKLKT